MKNFNYAEFLRIPLPREIDIIEAWGVNSCIPVVSIICITFNHELYIEDAIRGFLIQRTRFPFEIIIHDDASVDETSAIVKFYSSKYPRIIKTIFQKENQYSKGKYITLLALSKAKGKYFAICEGDDFWVNSDKLEEQTNCLAKDSSLGAVFTDTNILYQDTKKFLNAHDATRKKIPKTGDVKKTLIISNPYKTCSAMFKKEAILDWEQHLNFLKPKMGDYVLWLTIAENYNIGYISSPMATYRILSNSASHFDDEKKSIDYRKNAYKISCYFNKRYGSIVPPGHIKDNYSYSLLVYYLKLRKWNSALKSIRCNRNFIISSFSLFNVKFIEVLKRKLPLIKKIYKK